MILSSRPARPVAGVVLAAGLSRRFGSANKLLVPLGGCPVLAHTLSAYLGAGLHPVIVVVGHEAQLVRRTVGDLPVHWVDNPEYAAGQSRSLVAGVQALPPDCPAAVLGVGDQPWLTSTIVRTLLEPFQTGEGRLVVPRYAGRRGNPVLFSAEFFPELLAVTGDQGGRSLLQRHNAAIYWADFPDGRPAVDIDTPDDLPENPSDFPVDDSRV